MLTLHVGWGSSPAAFQIFVQEGLGTKTLRDTRDLVGPILAAEAGCAVIFKHLYCTMPHDSRCLVRFGLSNTDSCESHCEEHFHGGSYVAANHLRWTWLDHLFFRSLDEVLLHVLWPVLLDLDDLYLVCEGVAEQGYLRLCLIRPGLKAACRPNGGNIIQPLCCIVTSAADGACYPTGLAFGARFHSAVLP